MVLGPEPPDSWPAGYPMIAPDLWIPALAGKTGLLTTSAPRVLSGAYSFLGVPPSMLTISPVMNLASSELKNRTRLATSIG